MSKRKAEDVTTTDATDSTNEMGAQRGAPAVPTHFTCDKCGDALTGSQRWHRWTELVLLNGSYQYVEKYSRGFAEMGCFCYATDRYLYKHKNKSHP